MKKFLTAVLSLFTATSLAVGLSGCADKGKATAIGSPAAAVQLGYSERSDEGFKSIHSSAENFAASFAPAVYAAETGEANFAVSPISVYSALALAAECSQGSTRAQILAALGVDYNTLCANYSKLYRSVTSQSLDALNKVKSKLSLINSVWLDSSVPFKQPCIQSLSQNFFTFSYAADFMNDNQSANKALQYFIKSRTNGLIDKSIDLPPQTLFTLVNTLYLKDVWDEYGQDLPFDGDAHTFTAADGLSKPASLLRARYLSGRVYKGEGFTHFYASTSSGYKIKFILPDAGTSVNSVFNEGVLKEVNSAEYQYTDEANKLRFYTNCIFPEFTAVHDRQEDLVLSAHFGISELFSNPDFSNITDTTEMKSAVYHAVNLTVNRKGIEGAAVTYIPGAGAPGPDEYTDVYESFVIDRAFAFIITDMYNTTLFSGVVKSI